MAGERVWTVLLIDGGGGWVLGVFSSLDAAKAGSEQYFREMSATPIWRCDQLDPTTYAEATFVDDGASRIVITDYTLDEWDV